MHGLVASALITKGKEVVWQIINDTPGINQATIIREFAERTRQRVSQGFVYHKCQDLLREGLVRVERHGNQNAYFPTGAEARQPAVRSAIAYTVQEDNNGNLVVTSYTLGRTTVPLKKGLPLERLPEFHHTQLQFKEYLTG